MCEVVGKDDRSHRRLPTPGPAHQQHLLRVSRHSGGLVSLPAESLQSGLRITSRKAEPLRARFVPLPAVHQNTAFTDCCFKAIVRSVTTSSPRTSRGPSVTDAANATDAARIATVSSSRPLLGGVCSCAPSADPNCCERHFVASFSVQRGSVSLTPHALPMPRAPPHPHGQRACAHASQNPRSSTTSQVLV